jgi:hypothetical protein
METSWKRVIPESFRKKEYVESVVANVALISAAGVVLPGRPWVKWAFYALAALIFVALLAIRGKLEAIRFMLAFDFEEKIEVVANEHRPIP